MAVVLEKIKGDIKQSIHGALDRLRYLPSKPRIFIKPNIVNLYKPNSPYITNPRVIAAIIDYLKDININDIVIGECPVAQNAKDVFEMSGYTKLCRIKGVRLVNLNDVERVEVEFRKGMLSLPKIVFEREYINVSKLKTHVQTTVSLGIKNQKGLLSFIDRKQFHKDLHFNVAHLANIVRPDLSVIDATSGVEGNGPGAMGRAVKNIDLLICGTNFLETDVVATQLMGISPQNVLHLIIARDLGLGSFNVNIIGEDLKKFKMNFLLPSKCHRILNVYYWWTDEICSECSSLMAEIKRSALRNPVLLFKLFYYGLFKRLDFVSGGMRDLPYRYGKVICLGNCSKKFAEEYNLPIIPGCPPKLNEILRRI